MMFGFGYSFGIGGGSGGGGFPTMGDPAISAFGGSGIAKVEAFESWLGKSVDSVSVHTGRGDQSDYVSSVGYFANTSSVFGDYTGKIRWTIPLFWQGATFLSSSSDTKFDASWDSIANTLATRHPTGAIDVRTGWEFNGSWQPWAAAGKATEYVNTFRRFVDRFRAVSDRFRFEWCPNIAPQAMGTVAAVEAAYPGDAYVDVIGMDFYWYQDEAQPWVADPFDPEEAFAFMRSRDLGLDWLSSFGRAHGKPIAIAEWGVKKAGFGPYVRAMSNWLRSNKVEYHSYWDDQGDYPGQLSSGQYLLTGEEFVRQFGTLAALPDNVFDQYPDFDFVYDPTRSFYKLGDFTTNDMAVFFERYGAHYANDPAGASGTFGTVPNEYHLIRAGLTPSASWTVFAEAKMPADTDDTYPVLVVLAEGPDSRSHVAVSKDAYATSLRYSVREADIVLGTDDNFLGYTAGDNQKMAFVVDGASARFYSYGSLEKTNAAASALSDTGLLDTLHIGDFGSSPHWPDVYMRVMAKRSADDAGAAAWSGGAEVAVDDPASLNA